MSKPSERDLTSSEIGRALREALDDATREAVELLGRADGYWQNPEVRIPLPPPVELAATFLRPLGKVEPVREFQVALNRAAERAIPRIVPVFAQAIWQLRWSDAREILAGPDDAATRYFERTCRSELVDAVRPIVAEATEEVGVTRTYKDLERIARPMVTLVDPDAIELDDFVTEHALNGFFWMLAAEEEKIRREPVRRTSELLRRAFRRALRP